MANDTNVTALVKDSDGIPWQNAPWIANVVGYNSTGGRPPSYLTTGQPVTPHLAGACDGSGNFAATLAANDAIVPVGTQWEISFQPFASVQPSKVRLTLSGAALDASAAITPQLIPPRVAPLTQGFANSTLAVPNPGLVPSAYIGPNGDISFWDGSRWSFPVYWGSSLNVYGSTPPPAFPATLSGVQIALNPAGMPYILLNAAGAPADDKTWVLYAGNDGTLNLLTQSDSAASQNSFLVLHRNGVTPTELDITGNLKVSGALQSGPPLILPDGSDFTNIANTFGVGSFWIRNGAVNGPPAIGDVRDIFGVNLGNAQLCSGFNDASHGLYFRTNNNSGWGAWAAV